MILQKVLHFFHEKLVNKLNQFAAIGFSEVATSQFDLRGNGHSGIKVSQIMKKNFFLALTLVMLVAACLTSGYFYGKLTKVESAETTTDSQLQPSKFEQLMLKAESATGGKKMAMATASIDGDVDVLFTLDYESGILYAWLPGPGLSSCMVALLPNLPSCLVAQLAPARLVAPHSIWKFLLQTIETSVVAPNIGYYSMCRVGNQGGRQAP